MTVSERIKASLPLADEFQRDGHELRRAGSQFVSLCPFHQERTPSCHVNPATGRFRCFGCGADGTVIDYTALKRGTTPSEAIADLAVRVHRAAPPSSSESNRNQQSVKSTRRGAPNSTRPLPKLPLMHKGSLAELGQLAKLRRLSVEALRLASSRGLLWFCRLNDGPESVAAWVITDRTRRNAQARRLDGERWLHMWDADVNQWSQVEAARRRKVRGFSGNRASWPVGLEEAQQFDSIALVEGVDLLAAFHFLIAEGRQNNVSPVAMFGASNRITNDPLKLFAGKRVRMFPHADVNHAGLRAAATWEAQLRSVVARIEAFDLTGLTMTCGNKVKDLNDLTSVDPDCFESEPELGSIMNF
jgi:hypothetical protein